MKTASGIGMPVIIGLVVWWLTRSKQVQATGLLPEQTYPTKSEYEKLRRVVPITAYVERTVPVYQSIEEWEASHA